MIPFSPALKQLLARQLRSLLVVMLVLSLGVGTTVIQVIGWATMIPTQLAKTGSVTEAVENTFDGEHACPMCEIAAVKREAESSQQDEPSPSQPEKKKAKAAYTLSFLPSFKLYAPASNTFPYPQGSPKYSSRSGSPDTPPPQFLS